MLLRPPLNKMNHFNPNMPFLPKFNVGDSRIIALKHSASQAKRKDGQYNGEPTVQYLYQITETMSGTEYTWGASENAHVILVANNAEAGDKITIAKVSDKQFVYTRNGQVLMRPQQAVTVPQQAQQSQPQPTDTATATYKLLSEVNSKLDKLLLRIPAPSITTQQKVEVQTGEINPDEIPF